jgi:hypothetical protein
VLGCTVPWKHFVTWRTLPAAVVQRKHAKLAQHTPVIPPHHWRTPRLICFTPVL